ncbi:MAG: tetratricopeptide repeat protein [Sedimentisphaerales bacterium]|nr:tetratricopeptide repeat protein [Sedimentisphaerales bacterium]
MKEVLPVVRGKKTGKIRNLFKFIASISAHGAGNVASIIPAIASCDNKTQGIFIASGFSVGIISAFIQEILQLRKEKLNEKQQSDYEKFLKDIKKDLDKQDSDIAELLLARSVQYDFLKSIHTEIKQISDLLKDPEHAEIPEIIEHAGNNVIPKIEDIIQKQTEELKSHTTSEHKEQLNEIRRIIQEEFLKYFQYNKEPDKDTNIHNLPYSSLGDLFKGRQDDLNTLMEQIENQSQATAITQSAQLLAGAIHGLGGIGKTRLAVEYAWHSLETGYFKAALFVNCGQAIKKDNIKTSNSEQKILQKSAIERLYVEMSKLAVPELLNIDGYKTMEPEAIYHKVINELQNREDWLIVFDNVDDYEISNAIRDILPSLKNGKVIITSRLSNWSQNIQTLGLNKLSIDASIDYLLEKTKYERIPSDNDNEKVRELAEKLDGLPVALEQAAAYICYQKISFEQYLTEYNEEEERLHILDFDGKGHNIADYDKPVLSTWSLTEKKLDANAKAALTISAFLFPDNIPRDLLTNQSNIVLAISGVLEQVSQEEIDERLEGKGNPRVIRDALAQLNAYSMINIDISDNTFSIHRVVQEVARLRLSKENNELFTTLILQMIHNDCPDYQKAIETNYSWHKAMERHISGIVAFANRLWPDIFAIPKDIAGSLATQINNLSQFYQFQARFNETELLITRALEIDEKAFGKEHPNVAIDLNNLAQLYQDTNRLKDAEPIMKRALEIDEKAFGKEHPNVARDLNNLAQLYKATNRLKEAEPIMKKVISIFEKSLGENHPNVATAMNNLAQLYQATNRLKDAEPLMKRALEIDEKAFGKEHPNVAIRLNNLAQSYQATNRLKEAEPIMKRALEIDEKAFGKEHPNVAIDLNNLATLYQATNRLKEAEPIMERHLVIFIQFTRQTGHPHPHLQAAINNFAGLLIQMGYSEEQVKERLKKLMPEMFE